MPDTLYRNATLTDGAVWNSTALSFVNSLATLIGTTSATLSLSDSTMNVAGALVMGSYDADPRGGYFTAGTLTLQGSSTVTASSLQMNSQSALSLAPTASVVVGSGTFVAGAVVIGAGGTLDSDQGRISGDVIDDGTLNAHDVFVTGSNLLAGAVRISGTLGGTGAVVVLRLRNPRGCRRERFHGHRHAQPGPRIAGTLRHHPAARHGRLPDATILGGYPGTYFTIDLRGSPSVPARRSAAPDARCHRDRGATLA